MNSFNYDIFISYAHDDYEWVNAHLYQPLTSCRMPDGRPPRIFFDTGEDGIQTGQHWLEYIAQSIEHAAKVVPVYSKTYFTRDMCLYELKQAHARDPISQRNILAPIMIDQPDEVEIPVAQKLINCLPVRRTPDWFERLCKVLELTAAGAAVSLRFESQPGDVFVNHTLPAIKVVVETVEGPVGYSEQITIRSENGDLQGHTTRSTEQGVAVFDDLAISVAVPETRLIAYAETAGRVRSEPFRVHSVTAGRFEGEAVQDQPMMELSLPAAKIEFFSESDTLAVISEKSVEVFRTDGTRVTSNPIPLEGRLRIGRRRDQRMMLADWSGNVTLITSDGQYRKWAFRQTGRGNAQQPQGFVVPADIDPAEDSFYISFWSGVVWQLFPSGDARKVLHQPEGIQAFGCFRERLVTWDFDGNLRVYRDGQIVNSLAVEPVVHCLKECPDCLLAVGERQFYRFEHNLRQMFNFDMPLSQVDAVYESSETPVVIGVDGRGIRFDTKLIAREFHTNPGAIPVCADEAGRYCALQNPDGTHTLMDNGRIVFTHPDGALSFSPNADYFALSDTKHLRILTADQFNNLLSAASETHPILPDEVSPLEEP